jgi:hypothetical protein
MHAASSSGVVTSGRARDDGFFFLGVVTVTTPPRMISPTVRCVSGLLNNSPAAQISRKKVSSVDISLILIFPNLAASSSTALYVNRRPEWRDGCDRSGSGAPLALHRSLRATLLSVQRHLAP